MKDKFIDRLKKIIIKRFVHYIISVMLPFMLCVIVLITALVIVLSHEKLDDDEIALRIDACNHYKKNTRVLNYVYFDKTNYQCYHVDDKNKHVIVTEKAVKLYGGGEK